MAEKNLEEMPAGKQQPKADLQRDEELMELLSPARAIDLRIQRVFDELPEEGVVLLLEKTGEQALANARLARFLEKNNIPGVYVTLNKPLDALLAFFKKQKIDGKGFLFVDAITKMTSDETLKGSSFEYVDSPKNLIDLSDAIEAGIKKIKSQKKFIIFDSVNTLIVYNKPTVVEKFVHSISGKMRAWKAKGFFTMTKNAQEEVTKTIAQFCDETAEI